eukprot:1876907-Amphidinium_carterae.1
MSICAFGGINCLGGCCTLENYGTQGFNIGFLGIAAHAIIFHVEWMLLALHESKLHARQNLASTCID